MCHRQRYHHCHATDATIATVKWILFLRYKCRSQNVPAKTCSIIIFQMCLPDQNTLWLGDNLQDPKLSVGLANAATAATAGRFIRE